MASAHQENDRPQNIRAIRTFLREHAPFSSMDDSHLAHFAENASIQAYADGDDLTYAALVAPEVAAPIHQHLFCARFDMEVDGAANTAYRVDVETDEPGPDNPHGNAFRAVATRLETERAAVDVAASPVASAVRRCRSWRA